MKHALSSALRRGIQTQLKGLPPGHLPMAFFKTSLPISSLRNAVLAEAISSMLLDVAEEPPAPPRLCQGFSDLCLVVKYISSVFWKGRSQLNVMFKAVTSSWWSLVYFVLSSVPQPHISKGFPSPLGNVFGINHSKRHVESLFVFRIQSGHSNSF